MLGLFFGLHLLVFLSCWLCQSQVWDIRNKKKSLATHFYVVLLVLGFLASLYSILHLLESPYAYFIYDIQGLKLFLTVGIGKCTTPSFWKWNFVIYFKILILYPKTLLNFLIRVINLYTLQNFLYRSDYDIIYVL